MNLDIDLPILDFVEFGRSNSFVIVMENVHALQLFKNLDFNFHKKYNNLILCIIKTVNVAE